MKLKSNKLSFSLCGKYLIIYPLFIFFYSCGTVESQHQKIFYLPGFANGKEEQFAQGENINKIYFFNQSEFAPLDKFNKELLTENIKKRIPASDKLGYAALNWEGESEITLNQQKNTFKFNDALDEFIEVITVAKKLRPNIKWSFYGFPTTEFWNPDLSWENRNRKLKKLLEIQDYLAPSVYMFYGVEEVNPNLTENYLKRNLSLALRLGKDYNKPVFPFIWHRFHPSDEKVGMSLIPIDYFNSYIKKVFSYSQNSKRVNGIIWWNSEYYYYLTREDHKNLKKEYKDVKDPVEYNLNVFRKYLKIIEKNRFKIK